MSQHSNPQTIGDRLRDVAVWLRTRPMADLFTASGTAGTALGVSLLAAGADPVTGSGITLIGITLIGTGIGIRIQDHHDADPEREQREEQWVMIGEDGHEHRFSLPQGIEPTSASVQFWTGKPLPTAVIPDEPLPTAVIPDEPLSAFQVEALALSQADAILRRRSLSFIDTDPPGYMLSQSFTGVTRKALPAGTVTPGMPSVEDAQEAQRMMTMAYEDVERQVREQVGRTTVVAVYRDPYLEEMQRRFEMVNASITTAIIKAFSPEAFEDHGHDGENAVRDARGMRPVVRPKRPIDLPRWTHDLTLTPPQFVDADGYVWPSAEFCGEWSQQRRAELRMAKEWNKLAERRDANDYDGA